MLRGNEALRLTGTLADHSRIFQRVANNFRCVLLSRSVGPVVTGLLREGYATKGFHNKAKTSRWGPMAGFVLADAVLGRDVGNQRAALNKAIANGATETELFITEQRRLELIEMHRMQRIQGGNEDIHYYSTRRSSGRIRDFRLYRTTEKSRNTGRLWMVQYQTPPDIYQRVEVRRFRRYYSDGFGPVLAVVDPQLPASLRGSYLSATTGDYDLFAVFPERSDYSKADDSRMVSGSSMHKMPMSSFIAQEDPDRGNLTRRINRIIDAINREARYPGGNIVHHSDEAGRPGVTQIEDNVIGWVPGQNEPYGLREDTSDFRDFIASLRCQYVLSLNPGWHKDLGIGASSGSGRHPQGSYVWE